MSNATGDHRRSASSGSTEANLCCVNPLLGLLVGAICTDRQRVIGLSKCGGVLALFRGMGNRLMGRSLRLSSST